MAELLFEIGCEELPASFIDPALEQLGSEITSRLSALGVEPLEVETHGTPRRLVVSVLGLPLKQPDQNVEQRGPAMKAAFDESGQPTKALGGFCRGQGVTPSDVIQENGHVWVRKTVPGLDMRVLLGQVLIESIGALQFKKSMRWGDSKSKFARPVRWILAAFDGSVVPLEFEGVKSGLESHGHRFLGPGPFEAKDLLELERKLLDHKVELRKPVRMRRIRAGIETAHPSVTMSEALIEENAQLTEWPEAHVGSFRPEFLDLPTPVLTTVMAKHERFFPVQVGEKLDNAFVAIRNGGVAEVVSEGNAWVLNARFNDARFFYEEDRKHSLLEFLEKTSGMMFQEKLGSVRQRADRLAKLAREVAVWTGASGSELDFAERAGLLSKADLATGLVSELDELQGVIGGEYARSEGLPDPVCWAIASHYDLTKNLNPSCEGARTAVRLLMADQLDKLAGFMGIGFVPTGSSDPFALRRAATLLIESVWTWPFRLGSVEAVFESALEGYRSQGITVDATKAKSALAEVMGSRYSSLLDDRYDLVAAAMLDGLEVLDPRAVRFRVAVMTKFASMTSFVNAATRPANIVESARKKGIDYSGSEVSSLNLKSELGDELASVLRTQTPLAHLSAQAEDVEGLVVALTPLEKSINAFFDSTMVMVEEVEVRDARLKLLAECESLLRIAGDFTKIVLEG